MAAGLAGTPARIPFPVVGERFGVRGLGSEFGRCTDPLTDRNTVLGFLTGHLLGNIVETQALE